MREHKDLGKFLGKQRSWLKHKEKLGQAENTLKRSWKSLRVVWKQTKQIKIIFGGKNLVIQEDSRENWVKLREEFVGN